MDLQTEGAIYTRKKNKLIRGEPRCGIRNQHQKAGQSRSRKTKRGHVVSGPFWSSKKGSKTGEPGGATRTNTRETTPLRRKTMQIYKGGDKKLDVSLQFPSF